MKIKTGMFLLASCLFGIQSFAQQKIALHHNGATTIFSGPSQLANAYAASVSGDTLYLPGGVYNSFPVIDKKLAIYGAGYRPDSSQVTGTTTITTNVTISGNADSSFLQGLEILGTLVTSNNHKVDWLVVSRCKIGAISIPGNQTTPCLNIVIKENVIVGEVYLDNAAQSNVLNNLIEGRLHNGVSNSILNNVLLYEYAPYYSYYTLNNLDNCLIANNVFLKSQYSTYIQSGCDFSTFTNNVFVSVPGAGQSTFTNNYNNTTLTGFFVNQTGFSVNLTHDYHLTNPTSFLGNDGTVVGIYGGIYPFKLESLPENPHFQTAVIAPQTTPSGDLNVQIQVGAQNQ